ncbi:tyrosine-type recombinase/integrase, partial [[Eubacterium] rectale]|nr:tyrosine-type recombinase/integrase [Agathobacter rectalis]
RCGELCGLQVQDIDLNRQILHVRHSVNRGDADRGDLQFGKTKTESSIRNVHIPDTLIPLIRQHLSDYCDLTRPDSPVFVPKRARIMSQTTLDGQFAKARLKGGRPDLTFQA